MAVGVPMVVPVAQILAIFATRLAQVSALIADARRAAPAIGAGKIALFCTNVLPVTGELATAVRRRGGRDERGRGQGCQQRGGHFGFEGGFHLGCPFLLMPEGTGEEASPPAHEKG